MVDLKPLVAVSNDNAAPQCETCSAVQSGPNTSPG